MKTKQEVINFLESKVGTEVVCVGNSRLDGQCVTLIKALMEFLGVPNPYKARGHAKTVISAYLNEGIADAGTGFLSVFSNKNMGGGYGHIWLNAGDGDGTYYESNGAKPLIVTKGKTYSYDNVCNFDKYIKGEIMSDTKDWKGLDPNNLDSLYVAVQVWADVRDGKYVKKEEVDSKIDEALKNKQSEITKLNEDWNNKYKILADKLEVCQVNLNAKTDDTSSNNSGDKSGLSDIKVVGNVSLKIESVTTDADGKVTGAKYTK